jgi:S1-C subfamily serine protease
MPTCLPAARGFAIPISMTKNIMHNLIATDHVTRGWFGVAAQPCTYRPAPTM